MDKTTFENITNWIDTNDKTIKINKLPKNINPDKIMEEAIERKYGTTCPFCNLHNIQILYSVHGYVQLKKYWWEFWKPEHWCGKMIFRCNDCKAEWESPYFPQDLTERALK